MHKWPVKSVCAGICALDRWHVVKLWHEAVGEIARRFLAASRNRRELVMPRRAFLKARQENRRRDVRGQSRIRGAALRLSS